VLDRGYVGNTMVASLAQRGLGFCLRADTRGWRCVADFLRSGALEQVVTLAAPRAAEASIYEIQHSDHGAPDSRRHPSGNIRVLMTNLLDARRYPAEQFGALYHRRWRVEEAFKRIKHRLRLEAPSGLTYLAFQQDFAAKVLADNLCQLLSAETEPPDATSAPIEPTPRAPSSRSSPAASWRSNTPETSYRPCSTPSHAPCRIQPERSYPRPRRVKPHQHLAYKGA
jgi:hypothetical protein